MRQQHTQAYQLTAIDSEILGLVHQFHFLTALQIIKLRGLSVKSLPKVQTRLKLLWEHNYLARRKRYHTEIGNTEFIYALSTKSLNLFTSQELASPRFRNDEFQQFSFLHLDHCVLVSDCLIAATILHRFIPEIELAESRIDQDLKKTGIRVHVDRRLPDGEKTREGVTLVPDLWLDFRRIVPGRDKPGRRCIAVELDRGTVTNPGEFKKKIRSFVPYALSVEYKTMFADRLIVAYATTAGKARLKQMIEWCEQELTQQQLEHEANLYRFTALPDGELDPKSLFTEPVFYKPFQQEPVSLLWQV